MKENKFKIPPIDKLYPVNVISVIRYLEDEGATPDEVIKWFKKNNPDHLIECRLYYAYKNANRGNPLQLPVDEIDHDILNNA